MKNPSENTHPHPHPNSCPILTYLTYWSHAITSAFQRWGRPPSKRPVAVGMNASNASAAVPTRHQRTRPRWRANDEGGAGGCCWKFWGDGLGNFGVRKLIITYNFWMRNYGMSNGFLRLFAVFSLVFNRVRIIDDILICGTIIDIFRRGVGHLLCQTALQLEYRIVTWRQHFLINMQGFCPPRWSQGVGSRAHQGFSSRPQPVQEEQTMAEETQVTNDKCAKCRFGKWFFGRSVNMSYVGHDAGPGSFHTWNARGQASFNCWWHVQTIPYLELQQVHNYDSGHLFLRIWQLQKCEKRSSEVSPVKGGTQNCLPHVWLQGKSADSSSLLPWEFKVNSLQYRGECSLY